MRADQMLVEKQMATSREKARAMILSGIVFSDGIRIEKAGHRLTPKSDLELRGRQLQYVSRGGLKLEGALKNFQIDVTSLEALDVGASTGGFSDCLLQNGAARIFCVDVGYGQLAWELRQDSRITVLERTNFRHLEYERIGRKVDLIVIDASFISLNLILPNTREFLKNGGKILALVKPQFEAGVGEVGKRGIVKDEKVQTRILEELQHFAKNLKLDMLGKMESVITGKKSGNREFFIYLQYNQDFPNLEEEKNVSDSGTNLHKEIHYFKILDP